MFEIAVFVSGGGSNLNAIIKASKQANSKFKVSLVIADRDCKGIDYAREENIEFKIFDRKNSNNSISNDIAGYLETQQKDLDLIVLAGFLSILESSFIDKWQDKIINIHPSLLPKFGGKGMFGLAVHRAVINSGDGKSGVTVHFVESGIDTGKIISQLEVSIDKDETATSLQKKIIEQEHKLLPLVINILASNVENDNL